MKFKFATALLLAANALLVKSEVTFKVVAVSGKPSVVINGKKYPMEVEQYPIYSVTVDEVNAPVKYHYALDKEEEAFTRTADSDTTLNEFFNRSVTVKKHPLLPKAFESFPTLKQSKAFDDTFVATILVEADQSDIDDIHSNPNEDTKVDAKITYVSPYSIKVFNNANIKISGQSSIYHMKLSYKISNLKTDDDKELFGRTAFKLRNEYNDSTFMKEKTYYDILNAIGAPTSQGKFARVFINKVPVGLFLMTDDYSNKRFHRSTFNNGKKFDVNNAVFKVHSGGDLSYISAEKNKFEPYEYKGDEEKDSVDSREMAKNILGPFMKAVDDYPDTEELNLDIQSFLKEMVMEYLGCALDNYWNYQANYFIFKNMATDMWYFIDNDFDMTFGFDHPDQCLGSTLDDIVLIKNKGTIDRPLLDGLRSVEENEKFLRDSLEKVVKTVFNINALGPRIDSFAKLIREDAYWDMALPKMNKCTTRELKYREHTVAYFENEIGSTTEKGYHYPIKKWIIDRGKKVASIYKFSIPSSVSAPLGYFEPEYEKEPKDVYADYTPPATTTTTTTKKSSAISSPTGLPTSTGKCGPGVAICADGYCCSKYGYCGKKSDYCGTGCQVGFGKCDKDDDVVPTPTTTKKSSLPTSTGKCGPDVAVCKEGLCCSKYGYCGTTEKHCGKGCQSEFGRCDNTDSAVPTSTTSKQQESLPTSTDKCGPGVAICAEGYCCSKYGYCGKKEAYCGTGCQTGFGKCGMDDGDVAPTPTPTSTKKASLPTSTGKCGAGVAVCKTGYCCSKYGYCGKTDKHCGRGCQSEFGQCQSTTPTSTKKASLPTSTGKCGPGVAVCKTGYCCSKYGYCGKTDKHCGRGCQSEFGKCN